MDQTRLLCFLSHSAVILLASDPVRLQKYFMIAELHALRSQFPECRIEGLVWAVLQLTVLGIKIPTWHLFTSSSK